MRSKLLLCAALVGTCVFGTWSPVARAADPKTKEKKAKSGDSLSDDKVISKQMQWEDSVMGPDDKRAELDKIARAQAINKAAAEKAAKEKEKADAQAAKEAAAPKPQTSKRGGDVALPTLPDEDSGSSSRSSKGKSSEISPKLETAAAATPPPPVKHGDDKFIDKLLKDDSGSKKHKASASDDKALDDLLAVEKPKPAAKGQGKGKKDDVDSLLLSADKAPPMPETHVKHETPEWAKPEIASTPVQAPMPVRPQPKRDDGIIHVVQGAAPVGRPVPVSQRTVAPPPPPARSNAVATRAAAAPAGRRQAAPGGWNDPFATGPKKTVAARETHRDDSGADDLDGEVPVNRRQPAAAQRRGTRDGDDDGDSFKNAKATGGNHRAAPAAKPPKWKDPFTESEAPAPVRSTPVRSTPPAHSAPARSTQVHSAPVLATREPHKGESSKWDVAGRHEAPGVSDAPQARSGRWGVLKKHAH
jgi:hypothetical protein